MNDQHSPVIGSLWWFIVRRRKVQVPVHLVTLVEIRVTGRAGIHSQIGADGVLGRKHHTGWPARSTHRPATAGIHGRAFTVASTTRIVEPQQWNWTANCVKHPQFFVRADPRGANEHPETLNYRPSATARAWRPGNPRPFPRRTVVAISGTRPHRVPQISLDEWREGEQLTDYLLGLGHRDGAARPCSPAPTRESADDRLAPGTQTRRRGDPSHPRGNVETGRLAVALAADVSATAVFCGNDGPAVQPVPFVDAA